MPNDPLMMELGAFLEEAGWKRNTGPAGGPMTGYLLPLENGVAQITLKSDGSDEIELHRLSARPAGSGIGREAMTSFLAAVDKAQVPLRLTVRPFSNGLPENLLRDWYERLGFEEDTYSPYPDVMRREPQDLGAVLEPA